MQERPARVGARACVKAVKHGKPRSVRLNLEEHAEIVGSAEVGRAVEHAIPSLHQGLRLSAVISSGERVQHQKARPILLQLENRSRSLDVACTQIAHQRRGTVERAIRSENQWPARLTSVGHWIELVQDRGLHALVCGQRKNAAGIKVLIILGHPVEQIVRSPDDAAGVPLHTAVREFIQCCETMVGREAVDLSQGRGSRHAGPIKRTIGTQEQRRIGQIQRTIWSGKPVQHLERSVRLELKDGTTIERGSSGAPLRGCAVERAIATLNEGGYWTGAGRVVKGMEHARPGAVQIHLEHGTKIRGSRVPAFEGGSVEGPVDSQDHPTSRASPFRNHKGMDQMEVGAGGAHGENGAQGVRTPGGSVEVAVGRLHHAVIGAPGRAERVHDREASIGRQSEDGPVAIGPARIGRSIEGRIRTLVEAAGCECTVGVSVESVDRAKPSPGRIQFEHGVILRARHSATRCCGAIEQTIGSEDQSRAGVGAVVVGLPRLGKPVQHLEGGSIGSHAENDAVLSWPPDPCGPVDRAVRSLYQPSKRHGAIVGVAAVEGMDDLETTSREIRVYSEKRPVPVEAARTRRAVEHPILAHE